MRKLKTPPAIILLVGFPLNLVFLFVFSGVNAAGQRVWYLIDDAMISMSYARTFAETGELVWYEGADRVEGFTNPFWTLLMVIPHWIGLEGNAVTLPVVLLGSFCVVASGVIAYYLSRDLIEGEFVPCLTGLAVVATYPLIFWSMRGMEIGLLTLSSLTLVALAVKTRLTLTSLLCVFVVVFLSVWTRMDFAFIAFAVAAAAFLYRKDSLQLKNFSLVTLLGILVGLATVTLWRFSYYGEILPNTYTLKMTGTSFTERALRGVAENLEFVAFAVLCLLGAYGITRKGVHMRVTAFLLFAVVAVSFAYSVYVGGDAWPPMPSRYITPGLVAGTVVIIPGVVLLIPRNKMKVSASLVTILTILSTSTLGYQQLFSGWNFTGRGEYEAIVWNESLRDVTSEDAVIAVVYAGMGQYVTRRETIDLLGKMDKYIAAQEPRGSFWPGHNKWDLRYSILGGQPDVVANVWRVEADVDFEEYQLILNSGYSKYCLPYTYNNEQKTKELLVREDSAKVNRTKLYAC